MKFIDRILYESKLFLLERISNYGVAMLNMDFPEMRILHKQIDPNDLYKEKDNEKFGLEKETHITLLYGFHKEVSNQNISQILNKFRFPDNITLHNISLFENPLHDVLKFDVLCPILTDVNEDLSELPCTSKYPDYKPHLTIAYLKPGMGEKYVKLFKGKRYTPKPLDCLFREPNGQKYNLPIKIRKS